MRLVEVLLLHLEATPVQAQTKGRHVGAFLELLDNLEARRLEGKAMGGRRVPVA